MNKQLLGELAEWLEGGAKHKYVTFGMGVGILVKKTRKDRLKDIRTCKTVCCLAGAAVQFYNEPQKILERAIEETHPKYGKQYGKADRQLPWSDVSDEAKHVLGLDNLTAATLFFPPAWSDDTGESSITPAWAARVVRHLIATGVVDWLGNKDEPKG